MAEPSCAGGREPPLAPGEAGADEHWIREAVELSRRCPPSASAFSVGAILVSQSGAVISTGFSRERFAMDHAEEVALARAADSGRADLTATTIYSSLEPCRRRVSSPRPCAELIVAAGVCRVVVAWLEPPLFMPGGGAAWLRGQGVTVIEIPEAAAAARAVNAHLFPA
jgi:diaminohydroxyphosphoribosylaminopyrimidine deaminase / 5-amino-6-(5-phosphoribosylamino)uracil reductase